MSVAPTQLHHPVMQGEWHRLEAYHEAFEVVEVQTGKLLVEEDIERV